MQDEPVILIEGPRSVGKSTLLKAIADESHAVVTDLDDLATRDAVISDPALFVNDDKVVFIDEYQKAPMVLDAIKAELNTNGASGRFLLAGSTRYETLPKAAQSLTGRLHRLRIYPLAQTEIEKHRPLLVDQLFSDPSTAVAGNESQTTRDEYIERIARGGFPMALQRRTIASRNRWFDDYVQLTLERDALEVSKIRQATMLPRLLAQLAGQSAQVLNMSKAAEQIGLDAVTAQSYTRLLEAVFLVQRLPAWHKQQSGRASGFPKIHIVDSGVAARLLRLTPEKLARKDPTSLTEFGHLLESFVVGELQRQASWLDGISAFHWRTYRDEEVDLVLERDDGAIIAVEVKAGARADKNEFRHLARLRDLVGDAFVAGVVLYLGKRSYRADDRLYAIPVDRLWS
jgi:predicted AAA+ superfamily ATPase